MARKRNVRDLTGDIAGPGGPQDRNAVVIDATDAVLLDYSEVTLIEAFRNGRGDGPAMALLMRGRVNKSEDRAEVLFLLNADGAAAIATEIIGLAGRSADFAPEFMERFQARMEEMP